MFVCNITVIIEFVKIESDGMDGSDGRETRLFPDKKTDGNITCFGLTVDFLIYATDVSSSHVFVVIFLI